MKRFDIIFFSPLGCVNSVNKLLRLMSSSQNVIDFEEEEDPYISRIRQSGCYDQHVALQDCYLVMAEDGKSLSSVRDWRKCKAEMEAFKRCFQAQQEGKNQKQQQQ